MEFSFKSLSEIENIDIMNRIESIDKHVTHTSELCMAIQSDIDVLDRLFSTYYTQSTQYTINQEMDFSQFQGNECLFQTGLYDEQIKIHIARLNDTLCVYTNKLNESLNLLGPIKTLIIEKTSVHWKREQQLVGNGHKYKMDLNIIQTWCEKLYDLLWLTRSQIKEADRFRVHVARYFELPQKCQTLNMLLDLASQYISSLVASTFVIITQPPQVLKTNTKFSTELHTLIGNKFNNHKTLPTVNVSIVNEIQACQIIKRNKPNGESCGELINNIGTMEYQPLTRRLSINFKNMKLKKIKRPDKKPFECVMDEKYSILFASKFFIDETLNFEVWNLSLPVVVIVHVNQYPQAWATVTWDNAFSSSNRVPFNVTDQVPWINMAETLNMKFLSATGRGLSQESLTFLAEKAFRTQNTDFDYMFLSRSQFCKELLPQRNFTFWDWFYAVMKVTKEYLKGPWNDGAILGFIKKSDAEKMLTRYPTGTFLLRFSDSELGGLTIAWTGTDYCNAYSLHPFFAKDFSIRNLADRLLDLPYLIKLYPDVDKNTAFGKYYSEPPNNCMPSIKNGYVKPLLVTHLPGWSAPPETNRQEISNYPNTLQNNLFNVNISENSFIAENPSAYREMNEVMEFENNQNNQLKMNSSSNPCDISSYSNADLF